MIFRNLCLFLTPGFLTGYWTPIPIHKLLQNSPPTRTCIHKKMVCEVSSRLRMSLGFQTILSLFLPHVCVCWKQLKEPLGCRVSYWNPVNHLENFTSGSLTENPLVDWSLRCLQSRKYCLKTRDTSGLLHPQITPRCAPDCLYLDR